MSRLKERKGGTTEGKELSVRKASKYFNLCILEAYSLIQMKKMKSKNGAPQKIKQKGEQEILTMMNIYKT